MREKALERIGVVRLANLGAFLCVHERGLRVTRREMAFREHVLGTLGFEPSSGATPVVARRARRIEHGRGFAGAARRHLLEGRRKIVRRHGKRADRGLAFRQSGRRGGKRGAEMTDRVGHVFLRGQRGGGDGVRVRAVCRVESVQARFSICEAQRRDQPADDRRGVAIVTPARMRAQSFEARDTLRPTREMLAVDVREDPCEGRDLRRRFEQRVALLEPLSDFLGMVAVIGPGFFEKCIKRHCCASRLQPHQSTFAPESLTAFAHRGCSATIIAANWSGV